MVERCSHKADVAGSIPAIGTKILTGVRGTAGSASDADLGYEVTLFSKDFITLALLEKLSRD